MSWNGNYWGNCFWATDNNPIQQAPVNNTLTKTSILDKKQLRCQRSVIVSGVRDNLCWGLLSHLIILFSSILLLRFSAHFYLRLVCMIHVFLVLCSLINTKLCLWWVHLLLSQNINGCIPGAELAYTNPLIALITQLNHQISHHCVIVRPSLSDIIELYAHWM